MFKVLHIAGHVAPLAKTKQNGFYQPLSLAAHGD
jgi:hypothetical protein